MTGLCGTYSTQPDLNLLKSGGRVGNFKADEANLNGVHNFTREQDYVRPPREVTEGGLEMDEKEIVRFDAEDLICHPWGGEDPGAVITSLRLCDTGKRGSTVKWSSACEKVITSSGRVIRPKWGETPAEVIMTADIRFGNAHAAKEFTLTVLPDDEFIDPEYESDACFFTKLDLTSKEMESVASSVRIEEYQKAKTELLSYLQQKEKRKDAFPKFPSGMSKMMVSGFSTLQRCDRFYKGECQVSSEVYEKQKIAIQTDGLRNGLTITYALCALYNESVGVKIAGIDYHDPGKRPRLELIAKNECLIVDCMDNATVGAGKYTQVSLNMRDELYVRMFGEFLGDETFHSLFKFHIEDLESEVLEANLIVYEKKDMNLSGSKEILALLFPENTWKGAEAKWGDFKWQFANRNGLPQPDTWDLEKGFDFEYFYQRVRFMHFPWLLEEYRHTGDENILYYLIKTMTDFIKAKGRPYTYRSGHEHIGNAWRDNKTTQTLCGGWPRGLDSAERLRSFATVFGELVHSRFMTAEVCCFILKYLWDSCHALAFQSLTEPVSNLRQFEIMGLYQGAEMLDDFTEQPKWLKTVRETMENMMFTVTLEDGTYRETTGGYNMSVCENFIRYKKQSIEHGAALSDQFDQRLKRFAFYNALLQGPNGEALQYGDQGAGRSNEILYPELIDWFQDDELAHILTRGTKGKKPSWTSYHFPVGGVAMLRSGWQKDATYLFTQVRGGGSHGHQDDNHITLLSGGRVLLTDAGIFTYSSDDPYRQWGTSSLAHNTICINDLKQVYQKGTGGCRECVLDEQCDILTQSSNRYEGFHYTRKIVFIKPDIFIITDEMIPEDIAQANNYKQPWHMLPTARMSFNHEKKCMMSNFSEGVNIIIRSMDNDVVLKQEMGWYDYGYQQLTDNRFGYFEKRGAIGTTVFHTMLQIVK